MEIRCHVFFLNKVCVLVPLSHFLVAFAMQTSNFQSPRKRKQRRAYLAALQDPEKDLEKEKRRRITFRNENNDNCTIRCNVFFLNKVCVLVLRSHILVVHILYLEKKRYSEFPRSLNYWYSVPS